MDILIVKDNGDTIINLPRIEAMPLEKQKDLAYNLEQLYKTVVQYIIKGSTK